MRFSNDQLLRLVVAGLLVTSLFTWLFIPTASSKLYRWVDNQGQVHFTDNLINVPTQYRSQFKEEEPQPTPSKTTGNQSGGQNPSTDGNATLRSSQPPPLVQNKPSPRLSKEIEDPKNPIETRDYWQKRMATARRELAQAESELESVARQRFQNNTVKLGPGMQERRSKLAQQEADLQKKINDLRQAIKVGIPEEARRQGIPPGWLN